MRPFKLLLALPAFIAACHPGSAPQNQPLPMKEAPPPLTKSERGDWVIGKPLTHENLTVYLIHGRDLFKGRKFLSLKEALEQGQARVMETGNVNELAVENLSDDRELFIQAGEIVRGGKQDRVMGMDLLLAPRSGKVPIGAFCVEHGRWSARGNEAAAFFSMSTDSVGSNAMRMAIVQSQDQGLVWRGVAEAQGSWSASVGTNVADAASASSLQLSLENKRLQEKVAPYVEALSKSIKAQGKAIGLAVVINGKLYSADVYACSELFEKLWPKLLEAAATEAIAQLNAAKGDSLVTADDVRAFLTSAEDAKISVQRTSANLQTVLRESENSLFSETLDTTHGNVWLHRSYIKKPTP